MASEVIKTVIQYSVYLFIFVHLSLVLPLCYTKYPHTYDPFFFTLHHQGNFFFYLYLLQFQINF